MSELLVPSEVDALLRYPRGRVVKLAKAGILPAVFLPDGEIRFDVATIEKWIAEHRSENAEVQHA